MTQLRVLDLFSGIGGFSLGLERTGGFTTVAFCEIDPYCRKVLTKHWPKVPIYDDVRTLTADIFRRDRIAVDVICGGFPCQDLSFAGKRAGLEGARSGLWSEYRRLIRELRPQFVIVENVPGLLSLGMGTVLGDLAALRYDAVWDCIPACAVGAPHRRDRVWIIAHANSVRVREQQIGEFGRSKAAQPVADRTLPHTNGRRKHDGAEHAEACGTQEPAANPDEFARNEGRARHAEKEPRRRNVDRSREPTAVCDPNVSGLALRESQSRDVGEEYAPTVGTDWWLAEPDVGRVADGVPARVDRLRALGNAVVPQIPELIGRAILAAEHTP